MRSYTIPLGWPRKIKAGRSRKKLALMTTNLLKRLESSVDFPLTLSALLENIDKSLSAIEEFERTGSTAAVDDYSADFEAMGDEDDDLEGSDDFKIGSKFKLT